MNQQKNIFEVGRQYKVKQSFTKHLFNFVAGEILVYERYYYSHYDNSSAYGFRAENGEEKEWWLHDQEPTDSWEQFFEPINKH